MTCFLDKTFPEPIITIDDPSLGFAVNLCGWDEFDIGAQIEFKDGKTEIDVYSLVLSKPWNMENI